MRRDEARMEEVVLMLKVLWESPPVPTMSHCEVVNQVVEKKCGSGHRKGKS
jgi:hypothetical protein